MATASLFSIKARPCAECDATVFVLASLFEVWKSGGGLCAECFDFFDYIRDLEAVADYKANL
jgi:hypothetical protein